MKVELIKKTNPVGEISYQVWANGSCEYVRDTYESAKECYDSYKAIETRETLASKEV
jgi:hypothetical protein